MEKQYIVTLNKNVDVEHFLHHMIAGESGDCPACVPNRAVTISDNKSASIRSTEYALTDAEAEELRNHPDVLAVEPRDNPKLRTNFLSQTEVFSRSTDISSWSTNWGLRRCNQALTEGLNPQSEYTYHLDGTGVDVIIQDDGVSSDHPEWEDADGNSRLIELDWYAATGTVGTMPAGHYGSNLSNYHGSHVAGIVAGKTYGWAKNARIYSIRFDIMPTGDEFDLIRLWHEQKPVDPVTGVKRPTIVNASWGYSWEFPGYEDYAGTTAMTYREYRGANVAAPNRPLTASTAWTTGFAGYTRHGFRYAYIDAACQDMIDAGVIFVTAAGNTGLKMDIPAGPDYNNHYRSDTDWPMGTGLYPIGSNIYYNRPGSPYSDDSIIVGNIYYDMPTTKDQAQLSSERGPRVDVWAPGSYIMSAMPASAATNPDVSSVTTTYKDSTDVYCAALTGTSMASPQVTGLLALFLQVNPSATPQQCKAWLKNVASRPEVYTTSLDNDWDTRFSSSILGASPDMLFNPFNSGTVISVNADAGSTYMLTSSKYHLYKSTVDTTTISISTTGVPDGPVAYRITGLSESDITQSLSGYVSIVGNSATLTITANDDGVTHREKLATVIIGSSVIKFTLSN